MFVELAARTNFSFLRGGSHPKAIVNAAAALGYEAVGVADCDGLYGMVRAMEAAEEANVRLVVGCEVAVDRGDRELGSLWLFVANGEGYAKLCKLLTESHARHPKGRPPANRKAAADEDTPRNLFAGVPLESVCAAASGLWCLAPPESLADAALLRDAFGDRLSIAAWRHLDGEDDARIARAGAIARALAVPVCATNRVLFAVRDDKPVLDVLHCIREGASLDQVGRALLPNAEAHLKGREEMAALFADRPQWLDRSGEVANVCRFSLRELKYQFPCDFDPRSPGDGAPTRSETQLQRLRRLTYEGAESRYAGGPDAAVRAQIEKELALIEHLDVAQYFLSVRAVVDMARARDILCQGRGSAANSAVCFCLGVTAVDPAQSNLLFERFLSVERRKEPPDIDVDFEHERREEIIQAIYDTYGRDRAAMVSEVISYRGKSALREAGKAFGMSLEEVDRLSDLVSWWDKLDELAPSRITDCGFDPGDPRVRHVLRMAHRLQGFPRHLSIHVGGFVLSAEPLEKVAPIEPATMPKRTIVPWDKDDLDTLGFFKLDVLGLGMLTAIRKTLSMAAMTDPRVAAPKAIDQLARIPKEDPAVYDALCKADTVGVFQIESRAQMAMLPRLLPRKFYDLVVEVAIVRPGPIQGGMVHPYLRRRSGKDKAEMPHEKLAPILERTLGVPLFQEQVMQIAIVGAGYTGGEADQLRRDMAAWKRNGKLERHHARLLAGFEKNGITRAFADRLYQSIQGFGEYGFPESHAASFALLVYASSWLKVHHPAAFAASLINSQPMGFYSPASIVKDAERHGVEVLPVRVEASDWDCTLEPAESTAGGPKIRLGLRLVKGLSAAAGKRIEDARRERLLSGVEDLVLRASLDRRESELLARAGALEGFGLARREAMWKARAPREEGLFAGVETDARAPRLAPLSRAQQLVLDYRATGVAVDDHAMSVVRARLPKSYKRACDLVAMQQGDKVTTAGLVICRQRPGTASGVVFVTMEDETGFVNLILWSRTFERFRHVATTSSMLIAHGTIEREGEVVYVVPDRLEPLGLVRVPSASRDFH
jgi:error-prone DNA polymerase